MMGKRIFLVRPSFYAVFSAALLSVAVNLFTNLLFVQRDVVNSMFFRFMIFIILTLIISSGSFLYLSLVLEEGREKWVFSHFLEEIDKNKSLRGKVFLSFLIGCMGLLLAFTLIAIWLFHN